MVAYAQILASNSLINDNDHAAAAPRVAVFVGGTSGIGRLTLRALAGSGASTKIYLVGRATAEPRSRELIADCHAANPNVKVVWVEAEVSLLADTRRVCELIAQREERVDLLFLTAGYAPFGKRQETKEGLEVTLSLEFYSRVLFVQLLLPLLARAEAPRVVSVMGGGMEWKSMEVDDVGLREPKNFGVIRSRPQCIMLNTIALDKLAADNPLVTFIHSCPGSVDTGNVWRGVDDPNSVMGWLVWLFLVPLIRLTAITDEEAAQRYLFVCTSAAFGGKGTPWTGKPGVNSRSEQANGLFLVGYKNDCTPNAKAVPRLREQAQAKVWAHTEEVLRPYLQGVSGRRAPRDTPSS